MEPSIKFEFSGKLWKHGAQGGWVFVSLPQEISVQIRENLKFQEEGWGRMKALAQIGNTKWDTAIWFDKKHNTYLLPVKTDIRKSENLVIETMVDVVILV